jgi:uncharacterized repeat protein (TIGR01451 family)
MKSSFILTCQLLALSFLFSIHTQAQWRSFSLPSNGSTFDAVYSGSAYYSAMLVSPASSRLLILKSADGITWDTLPAQPFGSQFAAPSIVAKGDTIFLHDIGIEKFLCSVDGGASWFESPADPIFFTYGDKFFIHQNKVLFRLTNGGIYHKYLHETQWHLDLNFPWPQPQVAGQIFHFNQKVWSFYSNKVVSSSDGITWEEVIQFSQFDIIKWMYQVDDKFVILGANAGGQVIEELETIDGTNWVSSAILPLDPALTDAYSNQDGYLLEFGIDSCVFHERGSGNSYPILGQTSLTGGSQILAVNGSTFLTSHARTIDSGKTWQWHHFHVPDYIWEHKIAISDTYLFTNVKGSVLRAERDNLTEWEVMNHLQNDSPTYQSEMAADGSNLFFLATDSTLLYMSKNQPTKKYILPTKAKKIYSFDGSCLIISAVNQGQVYYSTDKGATFQLLQIPNNQPVTSIAGKIDGKVYVGLSDGAIYSFSSTDFTSPILTGISMPSHESRLYCTDNMLLALDLDSISRFVNNQWRAARILHSAQIEPETKFYDMVLLGNKHDLLMRVETALLIPPNTTVIGRSNLVSFDRGNTCVDLGEQQYFGGLGAGSVLAGDEEEVFVLLNGNNGYPELLARTLPIRSGKVLPGKVFLDNDGNGIYTSSDSTLTGALVVAKQNRRYSVSQADGLFEMNFPFYLPDSVSTIISNPYWQTTTPFVAIDSSSLDSIYLGIYFPQNVRDLSADITNYEVFRPGFETSIMVTIKNIGTTDADGSFVLNLPTGLTFIQAFPMPASTTADSLIFDIPVIKVGEIHRIIVHVKTLATAQIGSFLHVNGLLYPVQNDQNPANNAVVLNGEVVGSYDPNDKAVQPKYLHPDMVHLGERIIYTIRFQNTGNYPASFVRIVDTLSHRLRVPSIDLISASHDFTWSISDRNVLEVFFPNINLPDSITNEPESHGFVKFSVLPDSILQLGDKIDNTAFIYFDFNLPVVTNTVSTEVKIVNTYEPVIGSLIFEVTPNPGSTNFHLKASKIEPEPVLLTVYDASGKLVLNFGYRSIDTDMPFPYWTPVPGTYIVSLSTNSGKRGSQILIVR